MSGPNHPPPAGPGSAQAAPNLGSRQRFGRVVEAAPRSPCGGATGRGRYYTASDDESGVIVSFQHADIVTEGLRAVRPGERIRFVVDAAFPDRALFVIRLDVPDVEDFYR